MSVKHNSPKNQTRDIDFIKRNNPKLSNGDEARDLGGPAFICQDRDLGFNSDITYIMCFHMTQTALRYKVGQDNFIYLLVPIKSNPKPIWWPTLVFLTRTIIIRVISLDTIYFH